MPHSFSTLSKVWYVIIIYFYVLVFIDSYGVAFLSTLHNIIRYMFLFSEVTRNLPF